jgi:hypothetical protein
VLLPLCGELAVEAGRGEKELVVDAGREELNSKTGGLNGTGGALLLLVLFVLLVLLVLVLLALLALLVGLDDEGLLLVGDATPVGGVNPGPKGTGPDCSNLSALNVSRSDWLADCGGGKAELLLLLLLLAFETLLVKLFEAEEWPILKVKWLLLLGEELSGHEPFAWAEAFEFAEKLLGGVKGPNAGKERGAPILLVGEVVAVELL